MKNSFKCNDCGKAKQGDYSLYANGICSSCFRKRIEKANNRMKKEVQI